MQANQEIVITGLGVVSPIGIGSEAFWDSLVEGRSGVRSVSHFAESEPPHPFAGEILDFKPAQYVRPRKSLNKMSREIQLGFAAASLASEQAALEDEFLDPERFGVLFGADMITLDLLELEQAFRKCTENGSFDFSRWGSEALSEIAPLWMLKYLPNMSACHIGISQDARGPNNTLVQGEVSCLSAIAEAVRVLTRNQADVLIVGGTGSRVLPTRWVRDYGIPQSQRFDDPAAACRPFDVDRDGSVHGEGAAAFVLETRHRAEARGRPILARIRSHALAFEPHRPGAPISGHGICQALRSALAHAGLQSSDIGHVNAQGTSTIEDDMVEARAICDVLGSVPVTAPRSYFGNLSAGSGAVEIAASILAFQKGVIPPVLNCEHPDPECPIRVVQGQPAPLGTPTAVKLSYSRVGPATALILEAP